MDAEACSHLGVAEGSDAPSTGFSQSVPHATGPAAAAPFGAAACTPAPLAGSAAAPARPAHLPPAPYEFSRFACTLATLRETLAEHGVAILPSVLTSQECADMEAGAWAYASRAAGTEVSPDKPDTW